MGLFKKLVKTAIKNSARNEAINNKNVLILNNKKLVDDAINREIYTFLKLNNDLKYVFKSQEIYVEMRQYLISIIVDLRNNLYNFKATYIHKSPKKINEIRNIIKYYYELDKKTIIEINNEEVNDNIILIENKEIDKD